VVGEATPEGIAIVGIGTHPSDGLRKGVVVNIESTVNSIKRAVEEAELMAGCEINAVYAGIAGGHRRAVKSMRFTPALPVDISRGSTAMV
jgi:cell division protein FtsA